MSTEAEALAAFHRWADARRQPQQRPIAPIIAFLARAWAVWVLLKVSGSCTTLARWLLPAEADCDRFGPVSSSRTPRRAKPPAIFLRSHLARGCWLARIVAPAP